PPVDSASRSSIRILVVDDERTLRESCHSVLQAEGYNVVVCGRGNEARDTLRRRPFDITLVDWFMGEVPGSELLQTALGTNPATIVIIMTGNPSVASSLEALPRRYQLRRAARAAARIRDVRPLQGRVYRRGARQAGAARNGQRRHAVPRRADRDAEVHPGEAAPGDPGRRGAARGERDDRRGGERAVHR